MSQGEENNLVLSEVNAFVNDFLEYKLRLSGYQWSCPPPATTEETRQNVLTKAGVALRTLADEFSMQYKDCFIEMCERLELVESLIKPTIIGVANELFNEGIRWARIVSFFVFSGELAIYCKDKDCPQFINTIASTLSSYIHEKLSPWINDHGGWEGLVTFKESRTSSDSSEWKSWPLVKNLLCIGISAVGAISLGALLTKS